VQEQKFRKLNHKHQSFKIMIPWVLAGFKDGHDFMRVLGAIEFPTAFSWKTFSGLSRSLLRGVWSKGA
jgi:hypothetical protein